MSCYVWCTCCEANSIKPYVTSLFLEASSYEWPELEFHQDGLGILFSVKDLGWYGEGTTTLDFILAPDPHSNTLSLTMDFSMHNSGFMQLTTLEGTSDRGDLEKVIL